MPVNPFKCGCIEKLMELDIVYPHEGIYRFGNPFFREWVRRTYP